MRTSILAASLVLGCAAAPPLATGVHADTTAEPEADRAPEPSLRDARDEAAAPAPSSERPSTDAPLAHLQRGEGEIFEETPAPRAIEDGEVERRETELREADLHRARLMSFFRRGWSLPAAISRDEMRELTTVVSVAIGPELEIISVRMIRSSGHIVFDRSVLEHVGRLQTSGARIPAPPAEVADQYVGRTIAIRFRGIDAR